MSKITTIAAFDFDGTLTDRDTLLPFLTFARGYTVAGCKILAKLPSLTSYCIGKRSRGELKSEFVHSFFGKMPIEEMRRLGKEFANGPLKKRLRPEALEQLRWHQKEGHRCILVSANLDVYLKPWGELMGLDAVICSEVEFNSKGLVTGRLATPNCWGEEKVIRLNRHLGPRSDYLLYAYGDSRGDHEMLMLADYPFYCAF